MAKNTEYSLKINSKAKNIEPIIITGCLFLLTPNGITSEVNKIKISP
ncbi:MAG: hypothetical protein WCK98_07375 [bacterium]